MSDNFGFVVLTMTPDNKARVYGDWKGQPFRFESDAERLAATFERIAPEIEATVHPMTASSRKANDR